MGRQPLDQAVAEDRGGRPEAAGRGGLVDVEREARGGLAKHLAGRAVAWVAVARDLGAYLAAVRGRADEAKVEETLALRLGARALAGFGQYEALECRARRTNGTREQEAVEAHGHGGGSEPTLQSGGP